MNENRKIGFIYSWPVIIIAMFIFWPIGIFLLVRRISIDKTAAIRRNKLIKGLGITCYVISVLYIIGCLESSFTFADLVIIVVFAVGGYCLCRVAKKAKIEAENVKQYLSIIVNGNVRQIDAICSTTGKSYDEVKNDIRKMIEKGYLKNAYIDESARKVVLPTANVAPAVNVQEASESAPAVKAHIVACPYCGANNTIIGDIGECEYCGSPLK